MKPVGRSSRGIHFFLLIAKGSARKAGGWCHSQLKKGIETPNPASDRGRPCQSLLGAHGRGSYYGTADNAWYLIKDWLEWAGHTNVVDIPQTFVET